MRLCSISTVVTPPALIADDDVGLLRCFALIEPRERLVQKQEDRLNRERPRHLQALELAERQRAHLFVLHARQPHSRENCARPHFLGVHAGTASRR